MWVVTRAQSPRLPSSGRYATDGPDCNFQPVSNGFLVPAIPEDTAPYLDPDQFQANGAFPHGNAPKANQGIGAKPPLLSYLIPGGDQEAAKLLVAAEGLIIVEAIMAVHGNGVGHQAADEVC